MDLRGVRVLDLTRLLPGPYATGLLADAGADVVKIEDPDTGDYTREMAPDTGRGVGALFDAVNRGKRSVALDLATDAGREAFYTLAADADVVFEGFRPGVVSRLGVSYEDVRKHNPGIVYCSLSGYGQDGPLAGRIGHDLNYVGFSGLLDMTRNEGESPRIPGAPVADMAGGLFCAFAVVGALLSRELGARGEGETDDSDGSGGGDGDRAGEYIDVAMTDVVASFEMVSFAETFAGEPPRPGKTDLTGGVPWYDVYETREGYVTLAALEARFWKAFCEAVDREELVNRHGTTDPDERAALRAELADLFATRTRNEWAEFFAGTDAPIEGVYRPDEVPEHPQIAARGLVERSGESPRIGFPAHVSGGLGGEGPENGTARSAPGHGEHTESVLREAGVSDARIAELRAGGAIE